MNNVFSAKSETFAERCATKKILRSWGKALSSTKKAGNSLKC